ncbi:MAG: sulfatase [Planctomycetes bacterium]|nr:sulfatase [Planctomycetota bacterium]
MGRPNSPPGSRGPLDGNVTGVLASAFVAVVGLAAARALLFAVHDGYLAAGARSVGLRSFASDFWLGAAWTALPVSVGCVLARRAGALRTVAGVLLAIAAWGFLTGRWPAVEVHRVGFTTTAGRVGHALALGSVLVLAALVFAWSRIGALSRAGVLATAALLAGATPIALLASRRGGEREPLGIIVISLDTVRADRLGSYGNAQGITPALDRFATRATRFDQAFAAESFTLTSHMTLLTSLAPSVHRVAPEAALSPRVTTLAEALRASGRFTAAQVDDVPWLDARFGFARGFDVYRTVADDGAVKNEALESVLEDLGGEPFFLLVHYFDAHSDTNRLPYDSEAQDFERFAGWYRGSFDGCDARARCASRWLLELHESGVVPDDEIVRFVASQYDAGVASLDRLVGALLDDLDQRGLLDRSIVVVTADHGEELFEHGKPLHGRAYDESVRVPLLVRLPGQAAARVVDAPVGLVDVAPTLLDLAGVPIPRTMQGESFARLARGEADPGRRAHVQLDLDRTPRGVRTARWKWLDVGAGELYDLRDDPLERKNLAGAPEAEAVERELRELLARERARCSESALELGATARPAGLDGGARGKLSDLGYTGAEDD